LRKIFSTLIGLFLFLLVLSLIELVVYPQNQIEVSIGITAGIFSGLFVLIFEQVLKEWQSDEPETPLPTSTALSISHTTEDRPGILTEIHDTTKGIFDHLKVSGKENRELTFSNMILAFVAAIVALAVLGNDMYSRSGLPLPLLWIGTLFLLFGGIAMIYWQYTFGKSRLALLITIICGIIIMVVIVMLILTMLNGTHVTPIATGNVTNICENCSYPETNIVNNYNITVVENCVSNKNPTVSVNELKYLMSSGK